MGCGAYIRKTMEGLYSASNSAASDKGHTGALYSKNSNPAAEAGVVLFTTALGLYGGVLWSGELQGFIIHEMVPTAGACAAAAAARSESLLQLQLQAPPCSTPP
jgi:hypothetical protein